MFIISFYVVLLGFITAIYTIFGFGIESFTNPFFYLIMVLSVLVGFALSVYIQLLIMWAYGFVRKDTPTNSKHNHWFANSILRVASHLLHIKVITTGKEHIPKGNFVLMGNHQENYDIIIVKPILKDYPINFIAKESLFKAPFIGKWMDIIGNIPISKFADRSAAESIVKGIKSVKSGVPIGIFPEGKRSFSNEMLDFKPGAFKLAMKSKTDILVVTFYNAAEIKARLSIRPQKVYVHFNGVLRYEDYKELSSQELSEKVKNVIQEQLDIFEKDLNKAKKR